MSYFHLQTTVHHELAIVDLSDGSRRLFQYFLEGKGDGRFLQHTVPRGKAQTGYTRSNIVETDFLECSIGVPIFSQRFVDAVGTAIAGDVELHPLLVSCEGESFPFHLARINRLVPGLVDRARSSYFTLTDGQSILKHAVFAQVDVAFHLARDQDARERYVASEALEALVEAHGLRVAFAPA